MPAPRTKRVPDGAARLCFERLNRSGELAILIDVLWDDYDFLKQGVDAKLETIDFDDPKARAELQRAQGALHQTSRLVRKFEHLGTRQSAEETSEEPMEGRPAPPGTTKRRQRRL